MFFRSRRYGSLPMTFSTQQTAISTAWIFAQSTKHGSLLRRTSRGHGLDTQSSATTSTRLPRSPVQGILAPALSPDGNQVAFSALNQLWVMKIGEPPRQLTHGSSFVQGPQWSPDGNWLAYASDKDGIEKKKKKQSAQHSAAKR
jgi:dipeptidyl aminopeptidase/acylaminoacyl peptidase